VASPAFRATIIFDVLIANTDRVDRNFLHSGGDYCLIDHDKAFMGEAWTADVLPRCIDITPETSLFEGNLVYAGATARADIDALAAQQAGRISAADADDLDELELMGLISSDDVAALKDFLVRRSADIQALVQSVMARNSPA